MKTAEETIEEFKKDFSELLAKYNAEICIRERSRGYYTEVVGIEFEFPTEWGADYTIIRDGFEFNIGTWANKDNI